MKYVAVTFHDVDRITKRVDDFTVGTGVYEGNTVYTYIADDDQVVEDATHAVVLGQYSTSSMSIARILGVSDKRDTTYAGTLKKVIATFSITPYIQRAERARQAEKLRKQLEKMAQEKMRKRRFIDVLGDDENAMDLIKQLEELEK